MQFAACQRRLQHVASVHRAIGLAGADHGVQLIDEQDDLPFALGQVVEHALQALLEFTAELGTGNQRAHIQRQHALAAQALGHLVIDDALGQAFDNGSLAYAGTWMVRRISSSRPITGSSLPLSARAVRSMVYFSSACRCSSAFSD
ncbi:hypothetical protein G6F68_015800 [Rhizopus microsporus]|nr:hypothetical protein G6F68_015800 [Rhizopus microsporus]